MKNKQTALNLLRQIIEKSEQEDLAHKRRHINTNASAAVGESWMLFHLKALRELIEEEENGF